MTGEAMPAPHVGVYGAGSVGGFFGAMLARAGVRVTLLARPAHVEAIAQEGLVVTRGADAWRADVLATSDERALAGCDVVLVTVKSYDTAEAARSLRSILSPTAVVVSLQNGVDNALRLAEVLPNATYAAVVYVGADIAGPGRILHTGRGDLVLGRPRAVPARGDPRADLSRIAAMFEQAGVPCPVVDDIDVALWKKLTLNCAFNAISAIAGASYGAMCRVEAIRSVMAASVRETVAVGCASGVALDAEEMLAATWKLVESMPDQRSSTAQDLQRGKRTEIDALNGHVAALAREHGVQAPVNATLHALVKLREALH